MPLADDDDDQVTRTALVLYLPSEEYTTRALLQAFKTKLPSWTVHTERDSSAKYNLQYCDYDLIDWDDAEKAQTLTNSYILRKALIRKSYLHTTISHHLSKKPDSILSRTLPKTYPFQITHADELDELFYDELYELDQAFNSASAENGKGQRKWWILKPAMADKGQGIRLFDSKEMLQGILEGFENDSDDDDEDEAEQESESSTRVSLSTMRDWVIQEYISHPLLIDPQESTSSTSSSLQGRKFHLRVYALAVGALRVYISTDILALFAASPYTSPSSGLNREGAEVEQDLSSHLTNTCLQSEQEADKSVFLLSDLVEKSILDENGETLGEVSREQIETVIKRIGDVVGETFAAGLGMQNHFTVAENAFEIFGIDIILSNPSPFPSSSSSEIPIHLLEINACPDFRQSGAGLHSIIERLFEGVLDIAVVPFFTSAEDRKEGEEKWEVGQRKGSWVKCLDEEVRQVARPW